MSDEGKNNYKDSETDMGQKLSLCIKLASVQQIQKWTVSEFLDFIKEELL